MTSILLLSDTHGYLDETLNDLLKSCDEIWHAGDVGSVQVYEKLISFGKPVKGVYGNIDGKELRQQFHEEACWKTEDVKIMMIHIGGYPGKYPTKIKAQLIAEKPAIFICGHSHILKVIYDKELNLLHLNPGACGKEGFHKVRTALKFNIHGDKILDMAIIELGKR